MFGELCLNTTRHFIPSQRYRWTEESLAVNMGPAAAGLSQQGQTEFKFNNVEH